MNDITDEMWNELCEAAKRAREQAYAPYSEFAVGAAVLSESGEIFVGCNVENASIGATICAERTAIGGAVASGERRFEALCVVTDLHAPAAPCGICRQFIAEFCTDLPIMLANVAGERELVTLDEILPRRFGPTDLE